MKSWKRDLAYIREVGPDEPRFDAAVQRVWGEMEEIETERERLAVMIAEDAAQELERVKAERDDYRDTSAAKEHAYRDAEARLDKALAALREIGDDWRFAPTMQIARAAIAEIEGET